MASETIGIQKDRIVHETIDDEVIIIDLATGTYFSLTKSAASLWPAIVEGTSKDRLIAIMGNAYDAQSSDIEASVDTFLTKLSEEEIIVIQQGDEAEVAELAPSGDQQKLPFEPPTLERYTNMSDLLLLDPIHDVDEQGWPIKTSD